MTGESAYSFLLIISVYSFTDYRHTVTLLRGRTQAQEADRIMEHEGHLCSSIDTDSRLFVLHVLHSAFADSHPEAVLRGGCPPVASP